MRSPCSVFAGEITAESVNVRAGAAAGPAGATGDVSSSAITGLVVLGAPVAAAADTRVPLADWGTLELLATTNDTQGDPEPSAESTVVGLRIRLTADHGGLPAGAEIVVASATARSVAEPIVEAPTVEKPSPTAPTKPTISPKPAPDAPREPGTSIPGAPPELIRIAPEVDRAADPGRLRVSGLRPRGLW